MEIFNAWTYGTEVEILKLSSLLWEVKECLYYPSTELSFEINIDKEISFRANRKQMFIIIYHLIKNAIEAVESCGRKSRVKISCKKISEGVELIVTDNGIGIPQNLIDKVTENGFSTRNYGNGFGLTVVKEIVENNYNGSFKIESTEGKGTKVTLMMKDYSV